ncbi:hypothetical protein POF50_011095 [Streptomyces sp. SL13]|uniref:Uncharacterized protein n=1 Tax=Streptantibioticus silvisoli TaxID=2705255 RepID=A0AA90H354_9ACTN|nr:hypothetical protein [Streptantibioticus silvisoli]MDI5969874.1 hypothetical protein [Streptantibioticus silvisoli]
MNDNNEYFQFLSYRWNVTRAQEIARDLPIGQLGVGDWLKHLAIIALDDGHLDSADLRRPLILVWIADVGGLVLLIDGWHRLARAVRDGIAELPFQLLDEDQEYAVRIFGGSKPTTEDD